MQYIKQVYSNETLLSPKNSYEFFAPRADELQTIVKQHVMHKMQDDSKINHDPNLRVKYFALIRSLDSGSAESKDLM